MSKSNRITNSKKVEKFTEEEDDNVTFEKCTKNMDIIGVFIGLGVFLLLFLILWLRLRVRHGRLRERYANQGSEA